MMNQNVMKYLAATLMLLGTSAVTLAETQDFLSLSVDHYESDFKVSEELNYYRNFLKLENDALTTERIATGENSFILYRFDQANPNVMVEVASFTLTSSSTTADVLYNIEYSSQVPLAGYNLPVTTSGSLSVGENNIIDFSPVTFVDQFTASTSDDDFPLMYGYVLVQDVEESPMSTNTAEVTVMRTYAYLRGFYNLDDVMDDTEGTLQTGVKSANIELLLENDPDIYYYTVERGDETNSLDEVSRLHHRRDGSFMEMNDHYGHAGDIYESGYIEQFDTDQLTGEYGDYALYVPILWTFGDDRVKQDGENSYGGPILKTGVADVSGRMEGVTQGQWADENGNPCCIYYPIITVTAELPDYASIDYEPYMYRIWRVSDGFRGYSYDSGTGRLINDPSVDRSPRQLIAEVITDESCIEYGDLNSEYGFGALVDADINFVIRLYYRKPVFIIRDSMEESYLYYVVEKSIPWSEVSTHINEINTTAAIELSKTYINALGQSSDRPFDGFNIVITTYSDGSATTAKVIR